MGKFNTGGGAVVPPPAKPPTSPVRTVGRGVTAEGAPGYVRDVKGELWVLAVTSLVEGTAYETADARTTRLRGLIGQAVREDAAWVGRMIPYLRRELNLRSVAVQAAVEYALAVAQLPLAARAEAVPIRRVVDGALDRADEPGEFVAYWRARTGGRSMPGGVQRGVADAVRRLYSERAALRWDSAAASYRLADVVELTHPRPVDARQGALFRWLLDSRHGRVDALPRISEERAVLTMVAARADLERVPVDKRRPLLGLPDVSDRLRAAGMSWEQLSGWLQGPMDAQAWSAIIPSMGYMALLRNLRNFDVAGVADGVVGAVGERLADPEQVARSRQMPLRFLSAYRAAPSLRWGWALERALQACLGNVPVLPGRSLILVDTSGSMRAELSRESNLKRWDAAALFGLALGLRAEAADIVSFSNHALPFEKHPGESLLGALRRWEGSYFQDGGTYTAAAARATIRSDHARVICVTDEQSHDGSAGSAVPAEVPVYTWNVAGDRVGYDGSGRRNRHVFAGLTDAAFGQVPLLERGTSAGWPF